MEELAQSARFCVGNSSKVAESPLEGQENEYIKAKQQLLAYL